MINSTRILEGAIIYHSCNKVARSCQDEKLDYHSYNLLVEINISRG